VNVYDHIGANNRRTFAILCAFPVALFATVFLFSYLLVKFDVLSLARIGIFGFFAGGGAAYQALQFTMMVCPWIFLVAFLWIVISYYTGGAMILGMAHARRVTFEENRDLYRLVENTAIMAGLPTPEIYFIEDESMNAFATGRNPKAASIALTKGIVEKLDKAELQAVIAHELAHVGNRDTRLMIMIVAGIGCFIFFGELMFRSAFRSERSSRSGKSSKKGKETLILLVIAVTCLVFGYIIAPILRLALSRRREYQADATAVKITRDTDALARALSKIATDPRVEVLDSSPLVGNMCIADPAKAGFISRLYATHPPIKNRIAALGNMTGRETAERVTAGKMVGHPEER